MKAQWLDRELVRSPLYLALCKTPEAFHEALRRLGIPRAEWPEFLKTKTANATVHFFENRKQRNTCALVCVDKRRGRLRVEVDGLLIHEAVHVWQEIRQHIGESEPSSEFEAYSIQHLAQDLIAAYWNV